MEGLTPSQKGAVAEAAIAAAVIELGFVVLRPLCEGSRYDLMIDLEPRVLRLQCKLASVVNRVVVVRLGTTRLTPAGYVRSTYSATEVDAIGVYCAERRDCYLIPIREAAGRRELSLRLAPTLNNQSERIRWAADYRLGQRIAEMRDAGERHPQIPSYTHNLPGL